MTWQDQIVELFGNMRSLSTKTILDNLPINRNTLYYSVYRLIERGIIDKAKQGRFNLYSLKAKYQEFTYTLRVISTSSKNPRHKWDADLEITVSGTAPIGTNERQIRDAHKQTLIDKALEICSNTNPPILMIPENRIQFAEFGKHGISGIEMGKPTNEFKRSNDVELVFTNNIGKIYNKRDGLYGSYQKRIDEY